MKQALALAQKASSLGEVPVGAIVVKDDKVIGAAHNRRELDLDPCAHAEILAIQQAATTIGDWRLSGCQLYVTMEPCAMCTGAIVLSRIERCVYGCADPRGGFVGSVEDLSQHPILNHRFEVQGGVLNEACAHELKSFFQDLRTQKKNQRTQ